MNTTEQEIADHLEREPSATYEPKFEPSISSDPIITVKSQPLPDFGLDPSLSDLDICLIDFGLCEYQQFFNGSFQPFVAALIKGRNPPRRDICQDPLLQAPELTLGHDWEYGVDIWSFGCVVSLGISIIIAV